MFGVIAALAALTQASRERAEAVVAFFVPALDWIQRWLPLFYVPSLIMLPLALQDIDGTPRTHSWHHIQQHMLQAMTWAGPCSKLLHLCRHHCY